jgi:hypothetical protein
MAIFIDTGVFVAARNKHDRNYARARDLLRSALNGEYGRIFTSDYIVGEAVTLALVRTHNYQVAVNTGKLIIDSPRIEKIIVSPDEFNESWETFLKFGKKYLSFTDCASLVLSRKHGISRIMSFDSHFDGLMQREY